MQLNDNIKIKIEEKISQVPEGQVTTCGDLASLAGNPNYSRVVSSIANYGDQELLWHRIVNRFGSLASGFPGGFEVQAELLANEGVNCENNIVCNFKDLRWHRQN